MISQLSGQKGWALVMGLTVEDNIRPAIVWTALAPPQTC